jgi:hypothetical protein
VWSPGSHRTIVQDGRVIVRSGKLPVVLPD